MVIESGRWSKFGKIVGAIKRLKEVTESGRGVIESGRLEVYESSRADQNCPKNGIEGLTFT